MNTSPHKGFTLLELLIVIGILAILSAVTILAINPTELIKRSRDSNRISDLSTINRAINSLIASNSIDFSVCDPNKVYVSIASDSTNLSTDPQKLLDGTGKSFQQVTLANIYKTNGTGWIPLNLTSSSLGDILSKLPLDPSQTYNATNPARNYFYTFSCTTLGQYELNTKLESGYYGFKTRDGYTIDNPAILDTPLTDGGDNGLYETGNTLTLIPDSGLCPPGMAWVPSPGMLCIDRYEASYSASAYKVDGSACTARCPKSISGANPWTSSRGGWPSVPQDDGARESGASADDAIDYCANMGKTLPSDFQWYLAATGTPDPYTSKPARISGEEGPEPCDIWNDSGADGIEERPLGSVQCDDGYVWVSDGCPNIKTGTAASCKSIVGAYDMIGNAYEWVSDTKSTGDIYSSGNTAVPASNQTITQINTYGVPVSTGGQSGGFNSDYFWTASGSLTAGLRSGGWYYGAIAGRFALTLLFAPGSTAASVGFRCSLRQ